MLCFGSLFFLLLTSLSCIYAKHLVVFGGVCGISPGNVASYSCDYNTSSPPLSPTSDSEELKSYVTYSNSQIYAGMKWQCVEYARRYLITQLGVTFTSIDNAYQIFDLSVFQTVKENNPISIIKHNQGQSKVMPTIHSLLIWSVGVDPTSPTGHVAVITGINENNKSIYIGEQNWDFYLWSAGTYSRELLLTVDDNGYYSIGDDYIIGWIEIPNAASSSNTTSIIVISCFALAILSFALFTFRHHFKNKNQMKKEKEEMKNYGKIY